jgi:hypothetical protein
MVKDGRKRSLEDLKIQAGGGGACRLIRKVLRGGVGSGMVRLP